jgi:arginase
MKIEILTSPCSKGTLVGNGGGPAAVLHAGLLATLQADGHDVAGPRAATLRSGASAGDEMAVIEEAGASLAQLVREARGRGAFCLVLEGDCTAAPAVIAGLEAEGRVGVLWLDSHGDFNTPETTPSGLLGGMPVAVATGRCHPWWRQAVGLETPLQDSDVVLAGIRDLDPPERAALDVSQVEVIEARGNAHDEAARLASAVARLSRDVASLYVHVDVDVLNPRSSHGFTMPVPGGPTGEELAEMVALATRAGKVKALGISAFYPPNDRDGRTARAILHTVEAALTAMPDGVPML